MSILSPRLRFALGAVSILTLGGCPRARTPTDAPRAAAADAGPTWHRGEQCPLGAPSRTVQMVTTTRSTCALRGDGAVWCWGYDEHGEVSGHPEAVARNTYRAPRKLAEITGAVQLAASEGTVCARLAGGGVTCWGDNMYGTLGARDRRWDHLPLAVTGLTDAVEIAAGGEHFCARRRDGTVWCWGSNASGELGRAPSGPSCAMGSTPVIPCSAEAQPVAGLSDVRALALGGTMGIHDFSCAVKADGTVWCWGSNASGLFATADAGAVGASPAQVAGITDAVAIEASLGGACARRRDGSWWCFGDSYVAGQTPAAPAAVAAFNGAVAVRPMGIAHCALSAEGALTCGHEALYGRYTPTQSSNVLSWNLRGLGAVDGVASRGMHGCAWRCTGEAFCWGPDEQGQLGDGTLRTTALPQELSGVRDATQLAVGPSGACAVGRDGSVRCWGAVPGRYDQGSAEVPGWMMPASVPRKIGAISQVAEAAVGDGFACVRLADATVQCWGKNDHGQLGTPPGVEQLVPSAVPELAGVAQVVAGANHACARLQDSTVRCWGSNERGQLGDGTRTARVGLVTPRGVGPVASVVTAYDQSCAVTAEGGVWCWGHDFVPLGGEGEGDTDTPRPRVMREFTNVASLSMIEYVGCAVLRDGAVRCMRDGRVTADGPERGLTDVAALGGVDRSMCAVLRNGTARCMAEFVTPPEPALTALPALDGATQIGGGRGVSCALMRGGAVRCWGRDEGGSLGLGRTEDFPAVALPTPVRWPSS